MSFNIVKCSDIIDVRDGTHDSPKYIDKGYPLITSKNIKNNSIDFENVNFISEEDYNKINMRSSVENGDILMPMIGTVGNPVLVNSNNKFAIKNVALFKLSQNSKINSKYFYYLLMSNTVLNQLERHKRGGTQSFVSLKNLRELKIPYISIDKQKKIVGVLDKAQELIDKRKEQIEQLNELVKSRFIEIFGDPVTNSKKWEKQELGKVCDVRDGTHDSPQYVSDGYPLITSKNISNGIINFEYANLISKDDLESINRRSKVERGDIIMPMIGTIGNPVIVNTSKEFAIKNVALIKFDKNTLVTNVFVKSLLESTFFEVAISQNKRGGTQKFIALRDIRKLNIILPPMELQQEFSEFINQVDKLKFEMENSLKDLEDNFNALMQKAFKGELF